MFTSSTYANYASKRLEQILLKDCTGCMITDTAVALYPANQAKNDATFIAIIDTFDDLDLDGEDLENAKRTICALLMIMGQEDLLEVI